MKITVCFFFYLFGIHAVMAQSNPNDSSITKSKIEILYKNKDLIAINEIISDSSLEPQYILEVLNRNLDYAKGENNLTDLAKTHNALGNFWHKQANKLKAFENYLEAETIARKIGKSKILAISLMNKSTLLDDQAEKIKTLKEASQIFLSKKDTLNILKSYMNIGAAYGQLYAERKDSISSDKEIVKLRNKSFEYYKKTENLNRKFKNIDLESFLWIYYGEWYHFEKNYENAIQSFQKAQSVLAGSKNIKAKNYCMLMLAKILNEQKRYDRAIDLLDQAETMAEKYKFNDYLAQIYEEYVIAFSKQQRYEKALEYSTLFAEKSIELTEQSNQDKMQILSLEKNVAENQLQLKQYELKSQVNRILILSSLLIAAFIAGISYLIIKNNRRKIDNIEKNNIITEIKFKNQLLEDELLKEKVKFSQEHLMSFANQVTKIENFLDEMKTKFKRIPGTREEINSLKISFSELLNGQSQLKQINSLSSELNQDFFFYIKQNFPSITKGDEQLLAYIILDISSKEVGHILNISEKSIYMKRYRLRKKLKLGNEETFQNFYQKIISSLN